MTDHRGLHRGAHSLLVLAGIVGISLAPPAHAQSGGKGFLFQAPQFTLAIRGGFDRAIAGSDLFAFATEQLTLDRGDFSGMSFGADLSYSILPRLDLAIGASYSQSNAPSESEHFIGTDDLPIRQTTKFVRMPVTLSLKGYLGPRGESIGTLAWVPTRFSPFVGVGGGLMSYRFVQEGEFVDVETENLEIFRDRLTAKGWTPTAHGLAGFDFALSPRLGITTEARYTWARGEEWGIDEDFRGFERIDLSGLSATMGLHVRF
jgi:hypothetical protein